VVTEFDAPTRHASAIDTSRDRTNASENPVGASGPRSALADERIRPDDRRHVESEARSLARPDSDDFESDYQANGGAISTGPAE